MSTAPALVSDYVEQVVRRLRDLPPAEQAEIEADLRRHLIEIGCVTGHDCVERLGTPEHYAAGLREGMGLGEYRRPRRRLPIALIAAAGAVAVGIAGVLVLRDDPLPDDFQAVSSPMLSAVDGDAADTFGNGVQIVLDEGGTARIVVVVRNTSDETLDVTALESAFVLWRENGTAVFGGTPMATTAPTDVTMSQLWDPDVRIEPITDPTTVAVETHERTGAPFAPFRWEPGDAYAISVAGEVSACEAGWSRLDGLGGSITVSYTVRDRAIHAAVATIGVDAEACA